MSELLPRSAYDPGYAYATAAHAQRSAASMGSFLGMNPTAENGDQYYDYSAYENQEAAYDGYDGYDGNGYDGNSYGYGYGDEQQKAESDKDSYEYYSDEEAKAAAAAATVASTQPVLQAVASLDGPASGGGGQAA